MKQLQKNGVLLVFSVSVGYSYKDKNYSFPVVLFKIFLAFPAETSGIKQMYARQSICKN